MISRWIEFDKPSGGWAWDDWKTPAGEVASPFRNGQQPSVHVRRLSGVGKRPLPFGERLFKVVRLPANHVLMAININYVHQHKVPDPLNEVIKLHHGVLMLQNIVQKLQFDVE